MPFGNFSSFRSVNGRNNTAKKTGLLFFFLLNFGLLSAQNLSEKIYQSVDRLAATPSLEVLTQIEGEATQYSAQAKTQNDFLALMVLQCNLGYYYTAKGLHLSAILAYEKAWQNHEQHHLKNYDLIAYCLKPLGNLYTITGNYIRAENTIKTYIFLAEDKKNGRQKAAGMLNLSVVYHNIGNFSLAAQIIRNALEIRPLPTELRDKLKNNLSVNLVALKKYAQAEKTLYTIGQKTAKTYQTMAKLAWIKKAYDRAMHHLDLAENKLVKDTFESRQLAKIYFEKATIATAKNNAKKAQTLLLKALNSLLPGSSQGKAPLQNKLYAENTFIMVFDALASLQKDWKKALYYYDLSFYVAQLLRQNTHAQKAKILQQIDNRKRSEKCIALLYKAYLKTPNSALFEKAFQYAEKSKSAALKAILSRKNFQKSHPKNSMLQAKKKLIRQQQLLINRLIRAQLTREKSASIQRLTEQLNHTYLEKQKINAQLPDSLRLKPQKEIALSALQHKLKNDHAQMVVYFVGNENLYVFVVSPEKFRLKKIEMTPVFSENLKDFLQFFRSPFAINHQPKAYTASAYKLYQSLKLEALDTAQKIIIVPDGLLSFVPFGALLTQKTKGTTYAKMPFLLKEKSISYQTSAQFYLRQNSYFIKDKRVLGLFPVFKKTKYALLYSEKEAENIRELFSGKYLMGAQATKANFFKWSQKYPILHLSTHASSGSRVQPASIAFADGSLLVQELYAKDFHPKLVVLSACETGVGKIYFGENALSIARGFQVAGAENLIFSLWQVNDKSTAKLMQYFYANLHEGQSASEAIRDAKRNFLKDKNRTNLRKSPYYWSSFVYYGNFEAQSEKPSLIYIILFIVILAFGLYFLGKRIQKMTKN